MSSANTEKTNRESSLEVSSLSEEGIIMEAIESTGIVLAAVVEIPPLSKLSLELVLNVSPSKLTLICSAETAKLS